MSTLSVSNITDGVDTVETGYVVNGSAKAWVNYTQTTPVVNDSFNVSSVSDSGTGLYVISYTNAMSAPDYSVSGLSAGNAYGGWISDAEVSVSRRTWAYGGTTLADITSTTSVIGELA